MGFDNSLAAQRAREEALVRQRQAQPVVPSATAISDERLPGAAPVRTTQASPAQPAAPVATVAGAPAPQSNDAILEAAASLEQRQANSGVAPVQASPSNPAPTIVGNPGLSDENDFSAVSERESIQSDAQRIAQTRAVRQEVQPTAVPERDGNTQPNIVQYALETSHARGTRLYSRAGLNLASRAQRACAQFPSADQAQIAFLSSGGPRRDRNGLDPDGDGFACSWDPAPFRSAVQN